MIQAGDPTATGEGGESIYEQEREFETYDAEWARLLGREKGEKIVFGDELHSRLKFGRRGLVGMAKGTGSGAGGGDYGSQFFITLGDCRAELDGKCTMFGRVEGEGIYNVVKISEGEVVEGTERPRYPFKITGGEVLQMPKGGAWEEVRRRERAVPGAIAVDQKKNEKRKGVKKKVGKSLLSFEDEGDEDLAAMAAKPKKAKFNTKLISVGEDEEVPLSSTKTNGTSAPTPSLPVHEKQHPPPRKPSTTPHRQRKSPSPIASAASPSSSPTTHRRKPSFHDSTTQLPLKDPESPSNSPSPSPPPLRSHPAKAAASASTLNAEIVALKASMRRDVAPVAEPMRKKSALEQMIPSTSVRGRKRPRHGNPGAGVADAGTMRILDAFRAKLDVIDREGDVDVDMGNSLDGKAPQKNNGEVNGHVAEDAAQKDLDDEAAFCDLHFIANCQSCSNWDRDAEGVEGEGADANNDEDGVEWMAHSLSFAKDRLGKDLTWKRKNEEELVVIDPREKEKEIKSKERERRKAGGGGGGGR